MAIVICVYIFMDKVMSWLDKLNYPCAFDYLPYLAQERFVFWFYDVQSTVFQYFKCDSSQIHVSWAIFNQYLNSLLS